MASLWKAALPPPIVIQGYRGDMSQTSTWEAIVAAARCNMLRFPAYGLAHDPILLNPGDGYPMIEWSDLTDYERALILTVRVGHVIELNKYVIEDSLLKMMTVRVHQLGKQWDEDHRDVTLRALSVLRETLLASETIRKQQEEFLGGPMPKPARSGHLIGLPHQIHRAKTMIADRAAYLRKVQFNEPVNAFTMLTSRDSIARGGDLLTSMTVTSTEPLAIQSINGPVTVHVSKAVTL